MTDKQDLIREIHEYVTTHGGENTATHLLVQAASAIQTQAAELEAVGAGGVSGPLMGSASLSANAGEPTKAQIREVFMAHGFTVKEGQTDLKQYVYDAAYALLALAAQHTAQAEGWISVDERLPEPGTPVLLDIGKKCPIRAMWAAKHTVQAADDDTDWGEYVEADDMYYAPEGWYEWNQCEDNHWRVTETPRAWMQLPPTSAEVVEHG